jgi:hypothetical protein
MPKKSMKFGVTRNPEACTGLPSPVIVPVPCSRRKRSLKLRLWARQ